MKHFVALLILNYCLLPVPLSARSDAEFTGQLTPDLIPNAEQTQSVIMRPLKDASKVKFATPLESGDKFTAGRLYDPTTDKSSMLLVLVEPDGGLPYLYVDYDMNYEMTDKERIAFADNEEHDGIYRARVSLPINGSSFFKNFPVEVQFWKNYTTEEMKEGDRLIEQSTEAFAKGFVDIKGRKTLVQYGFNGKSKKINPTNGWVGVDSDGDGKIDMDPISPEAAQAFDENVVFRAGDTYVSTKRVDIDKNLIVMREHSASDYKRVELRMGAELPDFNFTDFDGKKRKLSEFRGKYVMIDFWGLWCPACRGELGYLKAAYSRYQARGFEILGMNDDDDISRTKVVLKNNSLLWTQAQQDSIKDVMRRYRIHYFPTSILIDPQGKIISLGQQSKGQPGLRGKSLLKSLDELLPP